MSRAWIHWNMVSSVYHCWRYQSLPIKTSVEPQHGHYKSFIHAVFSMKLLIWYSLCFLCFHSFVCALVQDYIIDWYHFTSALTYNHQAKYTCIQFVWWEWVLFMSIFLNLLSLFHYSVHEEIINFCIICVHSYSFCISSVHVQTHV